MQGTVLTGNKERVTESSGGAQRGHAEGGGRAPHTSAQPQRCHEGGGGLTHQALVAVKGDAGARSSSSRKCSLASGIQMQAPCCPVPLWVSLCIATSLGKELIQGQPAGSVQQRKHGLARPYSAGHLVAQIGLAQRALSG